MNGRLYDPKLHRFLSPDNFVQDPTNTQNFNRYGYVMNNPLVYTDPSGEVWFIPALIFIAKAAITGGAIAAASYTASVAFSKGGFDNWNWGQFGKSVGFGAISGIATAGIGNAFGEIGKFGHEVLRGLAHGVVQGGISELSGGNFREGFASGGLGSLAGSVWQSLGGLAKSGVGMIGFSALTGGIGAELTGGDFWRGAATGATVATLNHLAHMVQDKPKPKSKTQTTEEVAGGLGIYADTKEAILELAKKTGDLGKVGDYTLKATKILGRMSGLTQVGTAGVELYNSGFKSSGAWTKFGVSVLTLKANPYIALGMGIIDATGGTRWLYNKIDYYAK